MKGFHQFNLLVAERATCVDEMCAGLKFEAVSLTSNNDKYGSMAPSNYREI